MAHHDLLDSVAKICVLVTITYFASRTQAFGRVLSQVSRPKDKLFILAFFSILALIELIFSRENTRIGGGLFSPIDARIISATAAGLLGGLSVGVGVGAVSGIVGAVVLGHAARIDALPVMMAGALGGWVFSYRCDFSQKIVAGFLAGAISHGVWLAIKFSGDFLLASWDALAIQYVVPMAMSGIGVLLFLIIIADMRAQRQRVERSELARAIGLANRVLPRLGAAGLDEVSTQHIAGLVRALTGVSAAAITDHERVLAHLGEADDHHLPGDPLPDIAERAMRDRELRVTEKRASFCERASCPLTSAAASPLAYDGNTLGSVVVYESSGVKIRLEVAELAAEVAQFLTNYQMQLSEIERQTEAVSRAELKALQAQVHPHFLFNALNTISALCELDPRQAAEVTVKLGEFFRSSFRQNRELLSSLQEELAMVRSYLDIELARFGDKLEVVEDVEDAARRCMIPSFTIQPLVENAILHGISKKSGRSTLRIVGRVRKDRLVCWVIDDGRGFDSRAVHWAGNGPHALTMLTARLRHLCGDQCGIMIRSRPGKGTAVCLWAPVK